MNPSVSLRRWLPDALLVVAAPLCAMGPKAQLAAGALAGMQWAIRRYFPQPVSYSESSVQIVARGTLARRQGDDVRSQRFARVILRLQPEIIQVSMPLSWRDRLSRRSAHVEPFDISIFDLIEIHATSADSLTLCWLDFAHGVQELRLRGVDAPALSHSLRSALNRLGPLSLPD